MSLDLSGLKATVLGGDERETETLRLLQQQGAVVDAYGCPPSAEKVLGRPQANSVRAALDGAQGVQHLWWDVVRAGVVA